MDKQDDNTIDKFIAAAADRHSQEKAAEKKAAKLVNAYHNNALPKDLQDLKKRAEELVAEVPDQALIDWEDLMVEPSYNFGPVTSGRSGFVLSFVISDERDRRGLPDPEDYIDEDEERWAEIVAELPHDATPEEISEAIMGDKIERYGSEDLARLLEFLWVTSRA